MESIQLAPVRPLPARAAGRSWVALERRILVAVLLGGVLIAIAWVGPICLESRGPMKAEDQGSASPSFDVHHALDLDQEITLPGDPLGLAVAGSKMLVGNRAEPWGFMRLSQNGANELRVEKIPVIEPTYSQRMGFTTVTWNGEHYVGYARSPWRGGVSPSPSSG